MKRIWRLLAVALLAAVAGVASAAEKGEYVLGPGDVVRITVFQNPDLTTETRVTENGNITFPLVGAVGVGGVSIPAAEKAIAKSLKDGGFVLQPQVNILVVQMRGSQVAVLGQVHRPGRYPLETANTHLSELLAIAGGITPAGADSLVLTGTREGKPVRTEIDVPGLFLGKEAGGDDPVVQGGDIIYVHRAPMFYIYGEVQRPGAYRLERGMTVLQALAQGGGPTLRGTQRGIQIHRKDKNGKTEAFTPEMTSPVLADDVVYVKESLF